MNIEQYAQHITLNTRITAMYIITSISVKKRKGEAKKK